MAEVSGKQEVDVSVNWVKPSDVNTGQENRLRTGSMLSVAGQRALLLLFGLVLLDSMGTYLLEGLFGVHFPVNALAPVLMLLVMARLGVGKFVPTFLPLLGMATLSMAFLVGVFAAELYGWERMFPIAGIVGAILIGYAVGRWVDDENRLGKLLLAVGIAYVVVCVVALLKLLPGYLPVVNSEGYRDGVLVLRPAVTTDQNFQIFYLFYLAILFMLPYRTVRFWLTLLGAIGAAYVLARLQTRSGMLLFAGAMVYAWLTPLFYRKLGRVKMLVLPLLLLVFAVVEWQAILNVAADLLVRFTDERTYVTLNGRFFAMEYLLRHIVDPVFWVPQGNSGFVELAGNIPHFNPTAIYLQGGLLGLLAWVMLVAVPIFMLGRQYLARRLDTSGLLVFGGGMVLFVGQLTLDIPLFDQVWLWAGAVIGCIERTRRRASARGAQPA